MQFKWHDEFLWLPHCKMHVFKLINIYSLVGASTLLDRIGNVHLLHPYMPISVAVVWELCFFFSITQLSVFPDSWKLIGCLHVLTEPSCPVTQDSSQGKIARRFYQISWNKLGLMSWQGHRGVETQWPFIYPAISFTRISYRRSPFNLLKVCW